MRVLYFSFAIIFVTLFTNLAYSVPPVVTQNTVVLRNTTADMCPSSWKGNAGEGITETTSGMGESNADAAPGVLSCTGCAYNASNKTCVCATCYDYFDN